MFTQAIGGTVGGSVGGPVGAAVGSAIAGNLVNGLEGLFGANPQDKQRAARAQWFLTQAQAGNVAAAQCLLGGKANTASHESPMYDAALQQLQASPQGAAAYQTALTLGPYWSTSDTAAAFPQMQQFVTQWHGASMIAGGLQSFGLPVGAANALGTATSGLSVSPFLLVAGVAALVFLRRKS